MAVSRIARLTLFSGPQCSLCEIAKAELAKVRKQRDFDLEVINIQEKGQEKWKRKYVYWIPALHLDGLEIAKGRWDASLVLEALKRREANLHPEKPREYDCFIVDPTPSIYQWQSLCLYNNVSGGALGEEENALLLPAGQDVRLCFNCGSPSHAVSSCPEPIDRQVISLSRQLFNFLHPDHDRQEFTRFHEAEGWKQQRLEWLESFEPGVIRGPLLRDALGLREGDSGDTVEWLRNMAHWGYPPGWVSRQDPMELVLHRILDDEAEEYIDAVGWAPFTIFEGADDNEDIDLRFFSIRGTSIVTPSTSGDKERTRWATYPDTYFSSTALSTYSGIPLDKMGSPPSAVSVTFTPERRVLWEHVLSGGSNTTRGLTIPPWRMSDAFGAPSYSDVINFVPPPPPTTPPPLPPAPSTPFRDFEEMITDSDDGSVIDMEVSVDSE